MLHWSTKCLCMCMFGLLSLGSLDSVRLRAIRGSGICNRTMDGSTEYTEDPSMIAIRPPPITPSMQGQKIYCSYTFKGSHTQRVMIHIREIKLGQFDMYKNRCVHAYLRIWDGRSVAGSHIHPPNTLCGHDGPLPLWKFSTGRDLVVEYQVEYARMYMDFNLQYRFIDMERDAQSHPQQLTHDMEPTADSASLCDWTVVLDDCPMDECQILSPGYPGMYPPNIECVYRVLSHKPNVMMQINFQGSSKSGKMRGFKLRPSPRCTKDYLEVQDNDAPTENRVVAKFCSDKTHDILTTGTNMTLRFRSSDEQAPFGYNGFYLSVTGFTKEWNPSGSQVEGTLCDWDFTSTQGSVSTPEHWLPKGAKCTYSFHLQPGYKLQFRLNVYGLRSNCRDEILVYEEDMVRNRLCDEHLQHLENEEEPVTLEAASPLVRVVYKTSEGQYQDQSHRGFWMSFQQVPGIIEDIPVANKNTEEFLTSYDRPGESQVDHSSANRLSQRQFSITVVAMLYLMLMR